MNNDPLQATDKEGKNIWMADEIPTWKEYCQMVDKAEKAMTVFSPEMSMQKHPFCAVCGFMPEGMKAVVEKEFERIRSELTTKEAPKND